MDQHHNNSENYFLWALLANPATDTHLYAYNLQELVRDYPQSGILQALLAHASEEKNLKQASAYFNPKSLYKLINSPGGFSRVENDDIIIQPNIPSTGQHHNGHNSYLHIAEDVAEYPEQEVDHHHAESYVNTHNVVEVEEEKPAQIEHEHSALENDPALNMDTADRHHFTEVFPKTENGFVEEGVEHYAPAEEKLAYVDETIPSNTELAHPDHEAGQHHVVVEEAIEHLFGSEENMPLNSELIHSGPEVLHQVTADEFNEQKIIEPGETIPAHTEAVHETHKNQHEITEEAIQHLFGSEGDVPANSELTHTEFHHVTEEKLIEEETFDEITGIESINIEPQATHHSFGHEFGLPKDAENSTPFTEYKAIPTENEENQDLSKYNDEKMPYTFMWWLDKTRKDHSSRYQPYAKTNEAPTGSKIKNAADELQQQYYENIFHINSVVELDKSTASQTGGADMKLKEHVIIERFIQEEPQIKPQSSEKLDTENKAKKSSEDRDELVTETLAGIYSDQMLYHKAIASYRKLMLKFPEKSRYFAEKIEQLEKKTN